MKRAELKRIAKALGYDQANLRALVLEKRIGCHGRAMADFFNGNATLCVLAKYLGQSIDGACACPFKKRWYLRAGRADTDLYSATPCVWYR